MQKQHVFEPLALTIYLVVAATLAIILDVAGLVDGINLAITMTLLGTLFVGDKVMMYKTKQTLLEHLASKISFGSARGQQSLGEEVSNITEDKANYSLSPTISTTAPTKPLRVMIVNDQLTFREGVKYRLNQDPDIEVIGEAGTAEEAYDAVELSSPDIAILDIRLPDKSGIELARSLRDKWPELKILILTGYDFDQYVRALARLGIDGYLLKDSPQEALVQALRDIGSGGVVLPPSIASKVMRGYSSPVTGRDTDVWELTLRELDVMELLFRGMRNGEIARELSISTRTVEVHVRNLMSKLGAQSRAEAVRIALREGLLK